MKWFMFIYVMIPILILCTARKKNPISEAYEAGKMSLMDAWLCIGLVVALWPLMITVIVIEYNKRRKK